MEKKNRKSFHELYLESRRKPTPAQAFVAEVAQITHRAEATVIAWVRGVQVPDELVKTLLAEHFHTDAEALFPNKKNGATL